MCTKKVDVCIIGGGPAGMILGYLLAKQEIRVLVVEQHEDFEREYRGEVLQPRFIKLMEQIGLKEKIEQLEHQKLTHGEITSRDKSLVEISFESLSQSYPYAFWIPQPILLEGIYQEANQSPYFEMCFGTKLREVIDKDGKVSGVTVEHKGERMDIHASVCVGADGRFSSFSRLAGFQHAYDHYHNDVIWFSIPKPEGYSSKFRIHLHPGHAVLILPKYPDLLQIGITMQKGEWKQVKEQGISPFVQTLTSISPLLVPFASQCKDFSPFVPLQAKIFYVEEWAKDGALLIGDAAHCASPVGGVGVSLSVETAVVAASVIAEGIQANDLSRKQLGKVQRLRENEIQSIHNVQKRAEKLMLSRNTVVNTLRPYGIALLGKTGLINRILSRIFLESS